MKKDLSLLIFCPVDFELMVNVNISELQPLKLYKDKCVCLYLLTIINLESHDLSTFSNHQLHLQNEM
jgi:hypothetical protein